ncbi:MAG: ZIP family metal transporter [Marinifilaceae bacterium]|nr:ZIP family metal transporter [Marinifilaceae bacterium]
MTQVWISALGLCGASLIGSLIGMSFRNLSHKWNDIIMGYCAGIMLAASIVGLIIPAAEGAGREGWWMVAAGVITGALFLNLLDMLTPHLHVLTGMEPEQHSHNAHINKVLLFVLAIALHKLPEGIAAGVGFNDNESGAAWSVTIGIALQNIPEGMVIISPLLLAGVSRIRTLVISLAIGLLEIIGVWIGFGMGAISQLLLPIMLAFAGGAMLYVVSDEMIPETHAHGYQKVATYALLIGFMTLLFIDLFLEG